MINRRHFIKQSSFAAFAAHFLASHGAVASLLKSSHGQESKHSKDRALLHRYKKDYSLGLKKNNIISELNLNDESPIARISQQNAESVDFNGDLIGRPHDILWNIDGYLKAKGGVPEPSLWCEYAVVGGGMSGLLSAYHLKDQNTFLFEQDPRFGGNTKAECLDQEALFSIGAAYVTLPEEGSEIDLFFKELNLDSYFKIETDREVKILFKNEMMQAFWQGASDPERAHLFKAVSDELRRIYNEAYPEIPWFEGSDLTQIGGLAALKLVLKII